MIDFVSGLLACVKDEGSLSTSTSSMTLVEFY